MTELPKGWVRTTIDELLAPLDDGRLIHQGWSPQCDREPAPDGTWGVLKTTAIQAGAFQPSESKRLPAALAPKPLLEVRSGDLLLTCAGPRARCGVACLVRETPARLMVSGKMYRFRVNPDHIDPRFLEYLLLSPDRVDAIDQLKTGISESGLNLTHSRFRSLVLPVAPRAEQERIVAAIEEAFSKLDAGEAGLRSVRQLLKRMREAILAAAVTGRLVPQDPADTSVAELLGDLGIEPTQRTEDQLPTGWAWCELGAITVLQEYGLSLKAHEVPYEGDVPMLRMGNLQGGVVVPSPLKYLRSDAEGVQQHLLSDGDVLFNRTNSAELVGKAAVYRGVPSPATFASYLIRFGCAPGVLPSWCSAVINSRIGRAYIDSVAVQQVGQANVNGTKLKRFPIPLPPTGEQMRIMAEVERQLSFVEACERAVDAGLARSVALRRSVLKAAFEGRLVPQDPSDEPASLLSERIRAERAASDGSGGGRRRKKVEAS